MYNESFVFSTICRKVCNLQICISSESYSYIASAHDEKIHSEMTEILQVKD